MTVPVRYSLISIRAVARPLVVFGAVHIWAVVEGAVAPADGSAAALVEEVPVETGKGPVLSAFVLHKQGTLLCPELFQVSNRERGTDRTREREETK